MGPLHLYEKVMTANMMNPAKLKKLQEKAAANGAQRTAGAPRRKKKVVNSSSGSEAKKLQITLKKNGVNPFPSVDEVNMFKDDGSILHFESPKVQASTDANTYAIAGTGEEKQITELLPSIVNQLGPNNSRLPNPPTMMMTTSRTSLTTSRQPPRSIREKNWEIRKPDQKSESGSGLKTRAFCVGVSTSQKSPHATKEKTRKTRICKTTGGGEKCFETYIMHQVRRPGRSPLKKN